MRILGWRLCLGVAFGALSVRAEPLRFAVIGDAGTENKKARSVRESIARAEARRLVLPGDNLYQVKTDTYAKVWDPWRALGLLTEIVAIGNHHLSYETEREYFGMPANFYAKTIDGLVKFLVLNSDDVSTAKEQAAWFDRELEESEEPFVFPVFHHPSYTVSSVHSPAERAAFHASIRPLLKKHRAKITALLLGHDHLATLLHFDDLPAIVSGAVAECRRDIGVNRTEDGVRVKSEWFYDFTPHWLRLEVESGRSEARLAFVKATKAEDECSFTIRSGARAQLAKNCAVGQAAAKPPRSSSAP